jgi:hypothetical protein
MRLEPCGPSLGNTRLGVVNLLARITPAGVKPACTMRLQNAFAKADPIILAACDDCGLLESPGSG